MMTDSVIVGQAVGESALAAVGASYALTNVFISIAIGGGGGRVRSHQPSLRAAGLSQDEALYLHGAVHISGREPAAGRVRACLQRADHGMAAYARVHSGRCGGLSQYLFSGSPFLFMYNVLSAMFNALGRSKVPLYLLIFSSVLNVGLGPVSGADAEDGRGGRRMGNAHCPGSIRRGCFPVVCAGAAGLRCPVGPCALMCGN